MNTNSVTTYHCISCGQIVHDDSAAEPPRCCGNTMVNTVTKTIHEEDVAGEKGEQRRVLKDESQAN